MGVSLPVYQPCIPPRGPQLLIRFVCVCVCVGQLLQVDPRRSKSTYPDDGSARLLESRIQAHILNTMGGGKRSGEPAEGEAKRAAVSPGVPEPLVSAGSCELDPEPLLSCLD